MTRESICCGDRWFGRCVECKPESVGDEPIANDCLNRTICRAYRLQIHLNKRKRKAYTRNGLDWTKRFSVIAGALDFPKQAILDGEVVVIKDGRTNFSGNQDRLIFYAFDILYLDGLDLRRSPQIERKRVLRALLDGSDGPILYSEHLIGVGQKMFEHAAKLNWEGIVSKNADAPYRSDRMPRTTTPSSLRWPRPGGS